jgi:hypothetical protein
MNDPIERKVNKWVQNGEEKFSDINLRINHLNQWLFSDYEPAIGPGPKFLKRFSDWLGNIDNEEQQKQLFELVPNIFYIGRDELNVLYREAYQTVFARWLIDDIGKDFTSPNLFQELNAEVINTWFCPFTDSLRINQFYHINDIPGTHNHRPDWRSLRTFGDINLLKNYITNNGIKRIVLLEDFIGTGSQVSKTVEYAAQNLPDVPILIIPLIICPEGVKNVAQLSVNHPKIQIKPIVSVPKNYFVHEVENDIESEFFKKIHSVATSTYPKVSDSDGANHDIVPYGPFGFGKTGGLIVMHTNTPDNTLPLIHHKSDTWAPLFKRHKRVS